ncbi:uncharacterized protein LOC129234110 [Uloborus diversus]|uniref:uncharacterized protein LOC129234110 n=1 Tax=Uloborus diversus TaxID=327109 RepID=UPI00240A12F1|nr:uncharacterized protein LOC129234110 [Uloborus diversus]
MILVTELLFLALASGALGAAVENCHMDRLTKCGDPLAAFRKEMGQSFPTTEEQVKKLCDNLKEAHDCAENFQNKCMTPLQLETLGFLAEGSFRVFEEFCQEGSEMRKEYLKHAKCLDEATKTDEAKAHYKYVEASLEDLAEKAPNKRLPTACCGYQWLADKTDKMGAERCGEDAIESFHKVVDMAVSSLPSVLCSGFQPDSKECKEVLPPLGTEPKGTLKNSHIAQAFASIYLKD